MKATLRNLVLCLLLLVGKQGVVLGATCMAPMKDNLCLSMRYLRSQILVIGAQRELMQINYPYLSVIGQEIHEVTTALMNQESGLEEPHKAKLEVIQAQAKILKIKADQQDPLSLTIANALQKRCASCHSTTDPIVGIGWNDIFQKDWANINRNCGLEMRSPYVCRSINAILTAYGAIAGAQRLERKSFETLEAHTKELARISNDLTTKKMHHGSEETLSRFYSQIEELLTLSKQKNPLAFEKSLGIIKTCTGCHSQNPTWISNRTLSLKPL
jgi:hypothetical protein